MVQARVLDLSHHNTGEHGGDPDFAAIKDFGVVGVILKATQGTYYLDPTFNTRVEAAAAAGLRVGAYHFMTAADSAAQVDKFLGSVNAGPDFLVALDYEPNTTGREGTANITTLVECCHEIEDRISRKAVIYGGSLINETIGRASPEDAGYLAQHRFWLSRYGVNDPLSPMHGEAPPWTAVWPKPWLWQFAGDGTGSHGIVVPGIHGGGSVDMNDFGVGGEDLSDQWSA